MTTLQERLKTIILEEMCVEGVGLEDIQDDAPLFGEGLGLDSLDAIELVVLVKIHFGVQILNAEEGIEAFQSINVLADFIRKRLEHPEGEESAGDPFSFHAKGV
jgi:acyl carrier protein